MEEVSGRVTLAVLSTKLDNLAAMLADHVSRDHEAQRDMETRVRCNEHAITELKQAHRTMTGILSGIQAIVAAVAVWLGSKP
jgi:hypothetical protein